MSKERCEWVTDDPVYMTYHDQEWGNPNRLDDEQYLFEMLVLEGAQAGLSWITILKRREGYRNAFHQFDPQLCANLDEADVQRLKKDKRIIRNERKIRSVIQNANAFLKIQKEFGSFFKYIQTIVGFEPIKHHFETIEDIPVSDARSKKFSQSLKKKGFSFVGPVICYSYLQAIGMYQDHTKKCYLYAGR